MTDRTLIDMLLLPASMMFVTIAAAGIYRLGCNKVAAARCDTEVHEPRGMQ